MNKLKLFLSALLLLGVSSLQVRAEDSPSAYEDHLRSQQVYVEVYNSGNDTIAANEPVILDADGTLGSTLGERVQTTTTTDSVFAFGVADESIPSGTMGRVCIRGPHKVRMNTDIANQSGNFPTGAIISTSTTWKRAASYSTADASRGGQLGWLISRTESTDTGDTDTYWIWVSPKVHR